MLWRLKRFGQLLIVLVVFYQINCDNDFSCTEGVLRGTCNIINIKTEKKLSFNSSFNNITRYKYSVSYLNIKNSAMPYLPSGIFKELVNVNTLNIVDCGVREISRNDFENAKQLRVLNLSQNNITKLDTDVFAGAASLERLILTSNQIVEIDTNAFRNLNKLIFITLHDNKIQTLSSGVFSNVKLSSIFLGNNLIETLDDSELFRNLDLIDLDLSSNQLKTITQGTFESAKSVKQLNLSSNKLESLSLKDLSNIVNINLNNNQLKKLVLNDYMKIIQADNNYISNSDLFTTNKGGVISLSLKNNTLTSIDFVRNQTNLTYLDVSFNPLNSDGIDSDTFKNLKNLKVLYMESVNLQKIDYVLLAPLTKLEILDLSYNNLSSIDFHSLAILERLNKLYINGNNLATITLEEFDYLFPKFKSIDISDNHINCTNLIEILKKLKLLNIDILVDDDKLIANETNIRGIRCNNSTGPSYEGTKRPYIHPHDISITELNITEMAKQLKFLRDDNDFTQFQLKQILSNINYINLDIYADKLTETVSQVDDLKKQNTLLAEKLDMVLNRFNNIPGNSSTLTDYLNQISNLNKTLEEEMMTIRLEQNVNHDIKFVKIMVILLLVAGIIYGTFKVVLTFIRRRSPYRPSPYNTMGVNLDENNF